MTGAAGGIGRAVAGLFAEEGADLALVDIDESGVTAVAQEINSGHPDRRAIGLSADVSDEAACLDVVARAGDEFGGLDILVSGAVAREYHALAEAPAASWEAILGVNLLGTQNMVKASLPWLRQSEAASIVILSSVFAAVGRGGMGQYDATKAALLSLARTYAVEEAEHGIRVNAVCPGSTWTPYTASRANARGMTEAELRASGAVPSLMNRWAEPREIAYPVLWLACAEASFVSGTCLTVDGGLR